MLASGRALMAVPSVLLLDEPLLGLAPMVVQEIAGVIVNLVAEEGITVLLSEQNASLGLDIARDAYVLQRGKVMMHSAAEVMRNEKAVYEAYLGA